MCEYGRCRHYRNKKQCSRQLQCEVHCSVGNVVNSSLFMNSSLSSLSSTSHAVHKGWGSGHGGGLGGGRGVGGGWQGIFPSSCHVLHCHMVLRPKGISHNEGRWRPGSRCHPQHTSSKLKRREKHVQCSRHGASRDTDRCAWSSRSCVGGVCGVHPPPRDTDVRLSDNTWVLTWQNSFFDQRSRRVIVWFDTYLYSVRTLSSIHGVVCRWSSFHVGWRVYFKPPSPQQSFCVPSR